MTRLGRNYAEIARDGVRFFPPSSALRHGVGGAAKVVFNRVTSGSVKRTACERG